MAKESTLDKFKACVDQCVRSWNRTKLTDLEKWGTERLIIWGITDAALFVLPLNDYQKLKDYIYQEYGFNVGGALDKDGHEAEMEE